MGYQAPWMACRPETSINWGDRGKKVSEETDTGRVTLCECTYVARKVLRCRCYLLQMPNAGQELSHHHRSLVYESES